MIVKGNYAMQIRLSMVIALLWLCLCSMLTAITVTEGGGESTLSSYPQSRERDFYYHNYHDDYHLTGAVRWAVRFDFASAYPAAYNAKFDITSALIYLPSTTDSITVRICPELNNQPNMAAAFATVDTVSNGSWLQVRFANPGSLEDLSVAWLVIQTHTPADTISASRGGGSHSYFYNTNLPNPFFQSMAAAGLNLELLASVRGHFVLDSFDAELRSFALEGNFTPGHRLSPSLHIYNNSADSLSDVRVDISIIHPNPELSMQDVVTLNQGLRPYGEVILTSAELADQGHIYNLPDSNAEIKAVAVLHTENDESDYTANNTVTHYYTLFTRLFPRYPVENFVRTAQPLSQAMWAVEDSLSDDATIFLNYHPQSSDPFFATGAVQRFNWYALNTVPSVVMGGDILLEGWQANQEYSTRLHEAHADLLTRKTFLGQSNASLSLPMPHNQLFVRLNLRNEETWLFDGVSNPSLVMQSRFFAGLYRLKPTNGVMRWNFIRWGAYADTVGTPLTYGNTWEKYFSISLLNVPLDSLDTYMIAYWLQNPVTKTMLYANTIPVDVVVGNQDDAATPAVRLSLSPNPACISQQLKLTLPDALKDIPVKYSLYNTKGQCVQNGLLPPRTTLFTPQTHSAGVYLLRLSAPHHKSYTTKLLLYK